MTTGVLLDSWLEFSRDNPRLQQFGQIDDESTYNGSTGCTQTILQRLIKASTGQNVTHDQISQIASYPWPADNPGMRGMYSGGNDNEVGRVIAHFKLPYVIVFGMSWRDIIDRYAKLGPVMLGIRYGYWPEDRGYHYAGRIADGKPGGFAFRNGKSQLVGFDNGFHATLFLGHRSVTLSSGLQTRGYANEPNHGSASRPERPDYDIVLATSVRRAYQMYASSGRRLLAWIPTRQFRPKGY